MAKPVRSADWFKLYGTPSAAKVTRLRMFNMERLPTFFMTGHRRSIKMLGRSARWRPKIRDRPNSQSEALKFRHTLPSARWRDRLYETETLRSNAIGGCV